jgi:hypothetical protein
MSAKITQQATISTVMMSTTREIQAVLSTSGCS